MVAGGCRRRPRWHGGSPRLKPPPVPPAFLAVLDQSWHGEMIYENQTWQFDLDRLETLHHAVAHAREISLEARFRFYVGSRLITMRVIHVIISREIKSIPVCTIHAIPTLLPCSVLSVAQPYLKLTHRWDKNNCGYFIAHGFKILLPCSKCHQGCHIPPGLDSTQGVFFSVGNIGIFERS